MLAAAEEYVHAFVGDLETAVRTFCSDLESGDPATFKAGYTHENAVIATAEAFGLRRDTARAMIDRSGAGVILALNRGEAQAVLALSEDPDPENLVADAVYRKTERALADAPLEA